MSCEFCNTYDFTSIAVRDNNIHMAGGSSRYTDPDVNRGRYHLFNFCPLCGANLYYYDLAEQAAEQKEDIKPVVVAVDGMGNRVDYAIFDDETTLTEVAYKVIKQLREETGCGFPMCKDAYRYAKSHDGDYDMMIAYCKAKVIAVSTGNMPFDKRVEHFMGDKK